MTNSISRVNWVIGHFGRRCIADALLFRRPAVVRALLTHKDMTTTQRYAHLRPDAVREAALKSGELLTPKHGQVLKIVK